MSRHVIVAIFMVLMLVGAAVVALIWWSLADKFFPGAARSTGQGLPRRPREESKPVVVKLERDEAPSAGSDGRPASSV